jgi:hypothetical protein
MRLSDFQLPETIRLAQREFDDELAKTLDSIADRFEGQPAVRRESRLEACFKHLEQTVQTFGLTDCKECFRSGLRHFSFSHVDWKDLRLHWMGTSDFWSSTFKSSMTVINR